MSNPDFERDIQRLLEKRESKAQTEPCTPEKKGRCAERWGSNLATVCKDCESNNPKPEYTEYTRFLMLIHDLQYAGYPLGSDALSLEQWLDLARLKRVIEPPKFCQFMGR